MRIDGPTARSSAELFNLMVDEERMFGPDGVETLVSGLEGDEMETLLRLLVAREARSC